MSEYNFFAVVDASHDDDALYPTLSAPGSAFPVEITPEDGKVSYFQVSTVFVQEEKAKGGLKHALRFPDDIAWEGFISDTRVVVYCTNYDKGGGWRGFGLGAVVAVAASPSGKRACWPGPLSMARVGRR